MTKEEYEKIAETQYVSKTKFGLCKNDNCFNRRRDGSAYCLECSLKHKK